VGFFVGINNSFLKYFEREESRIAKNTLKIKIYFKESYHQIFGLTKTI
jgi:hypothetical protein